MICMIQSSQSVIVSPPTARDCDASKHFNEITKKYMKFMASIFLHTCLVKLTSILGRVDFDAGLS